MPRKPRVSEERYYEGRRKNMASLVKCCFVAVYFVHYCYSANALPTSPFLCSFASLEDCIRSYWSVGYKYSSIVTFLATYHGIQISLRQLKYLINVKYNLRRRRSQSTAHKIRRAVCYDLNGPGCLMGYRAMTRRLRTRYNLRVSRDTAVWDSSRKSILLVLHKEEQEVFKDEFIDAQVLTLLGMSTVTTNWLHSDLGSVVALAVTHGE